MVRNALSRTRNTSIRRTTALLLCVWTTFGGVSHGASEAVAQKQDSRHEQIRDEQCEELLRQPLTTLDLNGDGACNEIDVSLFKTLVDSCERERLSQLDRLEKLDLDCDGCISRQDVEAFRAYCEKVTGQSKLSTSRSPR
jgi:hypothetical protein